MIALLTLIAAVMPATRGLGIAAAVGLMTALILVLFMLTPLLAITGRGVFWPFIPRPAVAAGEPPTRHDTSTGDDTAAHHGGAGEPHGTSTAQSSIPAQAAAAPDINTRTATQSSTATDSATDNDRGIFHAVASATTRRPVLATVGTVLLLVVFACGLIGTRVGLTQLEQFAVPSDSAEGLRVMGEHFPAGEAQPHLIVASSSSQKQVMNAAAHVDGIRRVTPTGTSPSGLVQLRAVGSAEPDSAAAQREAQDLRDAVGNIPGAHALVGGSSATALDIRHDSMRDLMVVAPWILAVVLIVLAVMLRAVVAPLVLVAVNVLSALAAIGLGSFVGTHLLGFPALDITVPLLSFLFLVALGIDYTIFLVHRARHETIRLLDDGIPGGIRRATRIGMVHAVSRTGVVITSAGIVLAAVFAALGVLPLVVLGQLGLIVGLGVLVDTLLVRTVLVPALFALLGRAMWWPGRLARHTRRG
ncbi:MMPL family transporter [Devriesea agamarum]|uniref:MMPL family transporter n=1 Tax=Devriesea agamarum TaxID=472569 RepID=UPI000B21CDD8|nr:MMPL family transporter [Devriesea agamarum]